MKTKWMILLTVIAMAAFSTGCVSQVDGHKRAGVPFIKDKIISSYERPVAQIFAAAKEVLAANGILNREDTINKVIEAKVNQRTVFVKVSEVDPNVTQVTVQVRTKAGVSDIDLAAEIDKQIALRLK
ncbi:MAG: hypothetical protein K0Q55_1505 [Verrucomicrobia bacterium]|jgi:hypothetical protein|nr:hypothetical protein [Verrucomicrobiota bacterium]